MSHRIVYQIRQIAAADLPQVKDEETAALRPATDQELLDMDIVHLHDDLYSVAQQYRGPDSRTLTEAVGGERPGTVISEGTLLERHARLPVEHRAKVMRARIIRATDPSANAVTVASGNVQAQQQALADNVGDVAQPDGSSAPLVDLSHPDAVLEEAQRLVEAQTLTALAEEPSAPDVPALERALVPMALVDPTVHLVEEDELIPHAWHGERVVPPPAQL